MNSVKTNILVLLVSVLVLFIQGCGTSLKMTATADAGKGITGREAIPAKELEAAKRKTQTEESMKRDAVITLKIMRENAPKVRLNEYFNAVAYADDALSAYNNITKGLAMFDTPEAPVLMVTGEGNGRKIYGQPSTIRAYFNYLKDAKANIDDILNLKVDNRGKVIEVELRKNHEFNRAANQ